jgi:hypothetical protein
MEAFIAEGRIVAASLVMAAGQSIPKEAADDPLLGPLFRTAKPKPAAIREKLTPAEPVAPGRFGRHGDGAPAELSHFLIIADMKSRSINGLEEAVFNLGQAVPLLPQVWLLTTTHSVNAVRNSLVQKLGTLDMLFVIDTTHDKAAWHNFGPEIDARIRRVWDRAGERKSA